MIPCPVCLVVLDGAGGKCVAHAEWFQMRLWFPGDWPAADDLAGAADLEGGTELQRSSRLVEACAISRATLYSRALSVIRAAQPPLLTGGVFVGFRHFRASYLGDRGGYARAVEPLILGAMVRTGRFNVDQVEGIAHLFYELERGPVGPATPIEPGVQLLIAERG